MKCDNCGKELNSGERYCTKCNVNKTELELLQEQPKVIVKREKLCNFAAILFSVSGMAVLVRMIKSWYDAGLKMSNVYFVISIGIAAVFAFACLKMYQPGKLKKLLKALSIVLLIDLMWQIYLLVALAVETATDSGAAVSITVVAALLPAFIYSFLLPMHIIGVFKAKRILLFFLKIGLLLFSVAPIFNIIGFLYLPDFIFSYFETISSFFATAPLFLAMIIFMNVLPYVKFRFKQNAAETQE